MVDQATEDAIKKLQDELKNRPDLRNYPERVKADWLALKPLLENSPARSDIAPEIENLTTLIESPITGIGIQPEVIATHLNTLNNTMYNSINDNAESIRLANKLLAALPAEDVTSVNTNSLRADWNSLKNILVREGIGAGRGIGIGGIPNTGVVDTLDQEINRRTSTDPALIKTLIGDLNLKAAPSPAPASPLTLSPPAPAPDVPVPGMPTALDANVWANRMMAGLNNPAFANSLFAKGDDQLSAFSLRNHLVMGGRDNTDRTGFDGKLADIKNNAGTQKATHDALVKAYNELPNIASRQEATRELQQAQKATTSPKPDAAVPPVKPAATGGTQHTNSGSGSAPGGKANVDDLVARTLKVLGGDPAQATAAWDSLKNGGKNAITQRAVVQNLRDTLGLNDADAKQVLDRVKTDPQGFKDDLKAELQVFSAGDQAAYARKLGAAEDAAKLVAPALAPAPAPAVQPSKDLNAAPPQNAAGQNNPFKAPNFSAAALNPNTFAFDLAAARAAAGPAPVPPPAVKVSDVLSVKLVNRMINDIAFHKFGDEEKELNKELPSLGVAKDDPNVQKLNEIRDGFEKDWKNGVKELAKLEKELTALGVLDQKASGKLGEDQLLNGNKVVLDKAKLADLDPQLVTKANELVEKANTIISLPQTTAGNIAKLIDGSYLPMSKAVNGILPAGDRDDLGNINSLYVIGSMPTFPPGYKVKFNSATETSLFESVQGVLGRRTLPQPTKPLIDPDAVSTLDTMAPATPKASSAAAQGTADPARVNVEAGSNVAFKDVTTDTLIHVVPKGGSQAPGF